MFTKNPSFENLAPLKDQKIIDDLKNSISKAKDSLVDYYCYKQNSKSLHIFYMHERALKFFRDGCAILGHCGFDFVNSSNAQNTKELLIELMKKHKYSPGIRFVIERLPTTPFEMEFNSDCVAWMNRWERECSAFVMSLYFLSEAVNYAENEDKVNFDLIHKYISDRKDYEW